MIQDNPASGCGHTACRSGTAGTSQIPYSIYTSHLCLYFCGDLIIPRFGAICYSFLQIIDMLFDINQNF